MDPTSPTTQRLRLHASPNAASSAVRNSIISSSAKGWSPLQINKRDSVSSPIKAPSSPSAGLALSIGGDASSPRRTSSCFKHVARNSLVSNSPFKSPTTVQGQQAAGIDVDLSGKDGVIHERRGTTATRSLGQAAAPATGVASTPKASIGLGITATKRTPSGSAVSGTRKVSNERGKIAFPAAVFTERNKKTSGGSPRKVSGSKENESPDIRSMKRTPRQSMGLKGLAKGGYVSRSPFLADGMSGSRSSSGGGLAAMANSRSIDSPSPKTMPIPMEQNDIFSSPSPRWVSGGKRRVSPGSQLGRMSSSPSASPSRYNEQARSPMGPATSLVPSNSQPELDDTPTPTPHKSAITPSRRLRGPRDLADYNFDSPSKQPKTVTFQSVPDVKEFEKMSNEGSVDGSFEVQGSDISEEQEWIDEGREDDSLEILVDSQHLPSGITTRHRRFVGDDGSPDVSNGYPTPHESATADFMSALVEEGLFSPPEMTTPSFPDQPDFDYPEESTHREEAQGGGGFLETPSLGGSLHGTPLMASMGLPEDDRDEVGIPFGRTHHHDRQSLAHALPPLDLSPLAQPPLPLPADHSMLENIDASQPSLPLALHSSDGPHAHQSGTLPDPFITLATTTRILHPEDDRSEGGIPLGRSSHKERTAAARMLATQSIGLGMPRSPAIQRGIAEVKGADFDLSYDDSFASGLGEVMGEREEADEIAGQKEKEKEREKEEGPEVVLRKGSIFDSPGREMVFDASFELNDGSSLYTSRQQPTQPKKPLAYGPSGTTTTLPPLSNLPQPKPKEGATERKVSEVPEMVGPSRRMTQFKSKRSTGGGLGESPRPDQYRDDGDEPMSPRRGLPKPPAPPRVEQLDLPSPVTSPVKEDVNDLEKEKVVEKRSSKLGLIPASLPFIGAISPFFTSSASFENAPEVPADPPAPRLEPQLQPQAQAPAQAQADANIDAPLTPPRPKKTTTESPHRIPDFEFEHLSLHVVEPIVVTSKTQPPKKVISPIRDSFQSIASSNSNSNRLSNLSETTSHRLSGFSESTSTSNRFSAMSILSGVSESTSFKSISTSSSGGGGEFGRSGSNASGTGTGRVRQRISREMIKETIQQRLADGSISRRPLSSSLPSEEVQLPVTQPSSSNKGVDKDLPPPPPPKPTSIPMKKAHTTEATGTTSWNDDFPSGDEAGSRPKMRPRSQTQSQSAHEVAKLNAALGSLGNPQSALDRLANVKSSANGGGSNEKGRVVSQASSGGQGGTNSAVPLFVPQGILKSPDGGRAVSGRVEVVVGPQGQGGSGGHTKVLEEGRKEKEKGGKGVGRRRSLSVGDVDVEEQRTTSPRPRLTLGIDDDARSMLDVFREETGNIGSDRRYRVRERQVVTAGDDKVQHGKGGDIDSGRAWRQLRRPSDMNEHAAQIKAMKAKEADSGKATGTIFVKVLGIENLAVPIPDTQTFFCITLDNGIDYIRTPYSALAEGARVNQEFSLVEHPNFEFSLSLDIRRDPHILKAIHEKLNPPHLSATPSSAKTGLRNIFSSPRKPKSSSAPAGRDRPQTPLPPPTANTIAKYFSTPGSSTIAKTHISFKPISKNCEAKVLEIRYPMFAMFKGEPDRHSAKGAETVAAAVAAGQVRTQVAKITLQILRLPPISGVGVGELPGSIDEVLRGLRYRAWWGCEYHEGVLTQEGGDCQHPKRRLFKLVGGNLIAINEVTKKEVTSISLRKATGLVDLNAIFDSPTSRATFKPRGEDEGYSARARSFRVEFGDEDGIVFSADKDSEKGVWMTTLEGLIGKIPPNPLWAELLAAKQNQQLLQSKTRSASSHSLHKDGKRSTSAQGGGGGGHKRKPSQVAIKK